MSEAGILLAALREGIEVYRPASEHAKADFIFDVGGHLYRVQCKTVRLCGPDVAMIRLESSRRTGDGFARSRYRGEQVDLFAGYLPELERAYLIPFSKVQGMSGFQLRLGPARNGQRAGLNFASDYEFTGAVAQLGERRHGMAEARGSSPLSSTPQDQGKPAAASVGAHEFRNRFGWYMERVAAGEEIHVSRHSRPFVRLLPAERTPRLTEPVAARAGVANDAA